MSPVIVVDYPGPGTIFNSSLAFNEKSLHMAIGHCIRALENSVAKT